MDLDQTAIEIRARSPWEALDLGVLMVRRWWRPLMSLWLVQVAPLFIVLHLLFWGSWHWAVLALWWLKPLLERPLLQFLSRAIFAEAPDCRALLRDLPKLWWPQWFTSLTWRRFSPTRSLDLAVLLLEGMGGDERRARLGVLHRRDTQPAFWLTLFCAHLELLLLIGLLMLGELFIPEQVDIDLWQLWSNPELLMELLGNLLWLLVISLVAPLYIACGFALYLNRRVQLEAWDIELVFRQLAQRLGCWLAAFGLLLVLAPLAPPALAEHRGEGEAQVLEQQALVVTDQRQPVPEQPLRAGSITPEQARRVAAEVLAQETFHQTEEIRRPIFWDDDEQAEEQEKGSAPDLSVLEAIFSFIAQSGRLLLWLGGAGLLLFILWRYRDWVREHLPTQLLMGRKRGPEPIETLFGLDVRGQSLPPKPAEHAWDLWSEGHAREALALLYRATLAQLLSRGVPFHEGDTEGDCLARVRAHQLDAEGLYLARLTRVWQQIAYAHQLPDGAAVHALCDEWPSQFTPSATAASSEAQP